MAKLVNALSACALTVFANSAAEAAQKKSHQKSEPPAICTAVRTAEETKPKEDQVKLTIGYSNPTGVFGLNPMK